jgi:glycosyltransferase involved in cell wall biosynthesis
MKVAFCTVWDVERDGVFDYSRRLIPHLRDAGAQVEILPLGNYVSDKSYYARLAEKANASDLCHVQFNYPHFNGGLPHRNRFRDFAGRVKVPIVMTVHEVRIERERVGAGFSIPVRLIHNGNLRLMNAWSRRLHRRIYASAAGIIAHTRLHQEQVGALVDRPEKVVIIPHGIPDPVEGYRRIHPSDAKRRLGLDGKAVLTILGFVNRRKGYECALRAMRDLPGDTSLLIAGGKMTDLAGDRAYHDSLTRSISEMELADRVKITGYLSEEAIAEAMAATDICLAPFLSTAASGALSTCIAYRKPIVASDIAVNREINERIACLELFPQGSSGQLAAKVRALLASPERRELLADSAGSYAEQYGLARIAGMTVRLYDRVLAERVPPPGGLLC